MEQQRLERTWEEILEHSAELQGKQVILTILPSRSSDEALQPTLDQTLKGRTGRVNFQPSNLSERVGDVFTELLGDKD